MTDRNLKIVALIAVLAVLLMHVYTLAYKLGEQKGLELGYKLGKFEQLIK